MIKNFSVFPATEAQAGIARIATESEIDDGVNDDAIVTPKKMLAKLASALLNYALEANVPALASNAGMPSGRIINISWPTLIHSYTAPADGWVTTSRVSTAPGQYNSLSAGGLQSQIYAAITNQGLKVFIPVKKGAVVSMASDAAGALEFARFIYAEGVPA